MFYDKEANFNFVHFLSEYIWLFIINLTFNGIKERNSESDIIYVRTEQLVSLEPEAESHVGFKVFSWTCRDNIFWFAIVIVSSIPKQ